MNIEHVIYPIWCFSCVFCCLHHVINKFISLDYLLPFEALNYCVWAKASVYSTYMWYEYNHFYATKNIVLLYYNLKQEINTWWERRNFRHCLWFYCFFNEFIEYGVLIEKRSGKCDINNGKFVEFTWRCK